MVIRLEAQVAITPVGRPVDTPIPVAPVTTWVILVKALFTHRVGVEDAAPAVLAAVTVIVPLAFPPPQPPVNGML